MCVGMRKCECICDCVYLYSECVMGVCMRVCVSVYMCVFIRVSVFVCVFVSLYEL